LFGLLLFTLLLLLTLFSGNRSWGRGSSSFYHATSVFPFKDQMIKNKINYQSHTSGFELVLWLELSESLRVVTLGEEEFLEARLAEEYPLHGGIRSKLQHTIALFATEAALGSIRGHATNVI
jgi:hypothetical protein